MKQIDLKSLRPWQIDAAGAGLCVVLTLLLYLAGIAPLLQRRAQRGTRQAELAAQSSQALQLLVKHQVLRDRLAAVKKGLTNCRLELQPASHVNRRIAEISGLAVKAGLEIHDIQPGDAAAGQRCEVVPIKLAGKGTYVDCTGFLHRLSQAFPDTGVSSFNLEGDPGGPGRAAKFSFELLWYAAPRASL